MLELLDDHTELFKQFSDNANFKRWLAEMSFDMTYRQNLANGAHGTEDVRMRGTDSVPR